MVKHDYEDLLPPGSISMFRDNKIENKEYSPMARRIVNEWWYSQLVNKQHFYDILRILLRKGKARNESRILEEVRKYLDGSTPGVKAIRRRTIPSSIGFEHNQMEAIDHLMNKSILLATVYEALREIPLNVNENISNQLSVNRIWKPIYGKGNKIQISGQDNLNIESDFYDIRNRIYTAGGDIRMQNWWYNNNFNPPSKRKIFNMQDSGSINYFMNPPLGSIILFITDEIIRFNFIVSTTWLGDDNPTVTHWRWNGMTLSLEDHREVKELSIIEWVEKWRMDKNVGSFSWYSSDPFWGCSDSGFRQTNVKDSPFIIGFLNSNQYKSINQFINWPFNSPSI
jgi:hypothetical protein